MFNIYAIESIPTGRIYIGQTANVENRLNLHNRGHVKSTRKDTPWRIVALEEFDSRDKARWCEKKLKDSRGSRIKWIERHYL